MRSPVHLVLSTALLASLVLGGCDSREERNEIDRSASEQESRPSTGREGGDAGYETRLTTVRFVTLRNRVEGVEPGQSFGDERDTIRAGHCEVTWTPIRALDAISENAPIYIPSEDLDITGVVDTPMQTFWNEFVSENTGARPMLYVHGYNIGFDKGCKRAARFAENLALGSRLLFFSWPSDGAALNYTRDEADIAWSVRFLRETLTRMELLFGRGGFDVVAHSLGARGVSLALASMPDIPVEPGPLVERLVLIAADIDADIFGQLLPRLRRQAEHVTAYVSENDNALALSREVHGYPRLGEAGAHIVGLRDIEIIDVSALPLRRVSGHLYHLYNEPVVRDLVELLDERLPAAERSQPDPVDPTVPNYWRLNRPGD